MKVVVSVGDVLRVAADVLISTANPWLNMSGGVNGAIRELEPHVQSELHRHLDSLGKSALPPGSVVRTGAGSLPFSHIIHAVAIDPFYESSERLVADTLAAAFRLALTLDATSVSLPMLATGYGPISTEAFGRAFAASIVDRFPIQAVHLIVRKEEHAATIKSILDREV
ncbi:MAG: macro domain-containing protein [Aureliella sp.]